MKREESTNQNRMDGRCIIMAAGDFTPVSIEKREQDYVIAADGGFLYCDLIGLEPDCFIGDMDSVSAASPEILEKLEKWKESHGEVFHKLPTMKDDTDTLAAVRHGLSLGYREFRIYGGLGGRLDHSIANIQTLAFLKEEGATGYLMDANGMVLLAKEEEISFQKGLYGMISVFSMGEKAEGVSISGLKYSLENAVLTNAFPIGVSNEFIGEEAHIRVDRGTLLIIVSLAQE